ncbi:MAG: OOP family OmpA-OmpF porin [Colwellia sp.]|jgi:OOP family OmpA-OmpF porin
MKFIIFISVFFLSACSVQVIDMTPEPTTQKFNLTDSEGDGIIKARDDCPDTGIGVKVGNNGCSSSTVQTVRQRLDVNFDTNSSVVKSKYLPNIKALADFMTEYPQVIVSIEGHTSILGSARHNKKLSNNRARSIKDILIQRFDIVNDRITTVGYGFEKILSEGDDEYSHGKNRRIVAEISSDKSLTDMKWTIYSVDSEVE